MSCEQAMERILDRTGGELDPAAAAELERHLDGCPACAAEAEAMASLWAELGDDSGAAVPSEALRRRFRELLARERELPSAVPVAIAPPSVGTRDAGGGAAVPGAAVGAPRAEARRFGRVPRRRSGNLLALAAALAVTLGAGVYLGSTLDRPPGLAGDPEVAALREEVRSLQTTVALALLGDASASERLSGVAYGRALGDDRIADALFRALLEDPNVNVRLVALDALAERAGRPGDRARLVRSIRAQDSPLVQITAIDVLFEHALDADAPAGASGGGAGAAPADLASLASDPDLDEVVRGYLVDRLERSRR